MNRNPYVNALLAFSYVACVSTFLKYAHYLFGEQDPVFAPIMFLSLLVLSASLMGYLMLALPLQLYLDGHKKQAVESFFHTVGTFAALTVAIWTLALILR
jgi:hypothetical protein